MATFGYTIIFSSSTYDVNTKQATTKQIIDKQSRQINEINAILKQQFNNPRYECELDHLMLFNIRFYNMDKRITYHGLYVISLAEISNPLFITNTQLDKLLDSDRKTQINDIYCSYPSFRFNKFHTGDFFHIENSDKNLQYGDSGKIVINTPQTNSHGLVRC